MAGREEQVDAAGGSCAPLPARLRLARRRRQARRARRAIAVGTWAASVLALAAGLAGLAASLR
jgi:hypothetical protein